MKYCFLIILYLIVCRASAQKAKINNIDSIYYIVDTANTPLKERMLDIGIELPYKYIAIKCPCLKYNAEPTFIYRIKDTGQLTDKNAFDKLSTVSLVNLINLAKQTTNLTATTLYVYFFIERKNNNEYVIHSVRLVTPQKPEVIIDYENVPPTDSTKLNKH